MQESRLTVLSQTWNEVLGMLSEHLPPQKIPGPTCFLGYLHMDESLLLMCYCSL
jgi:hypothetical protein